MLKFIRENEVSKVYQCTDCSQFHSYPRSYEVGEDDEHPHCTKKPVFHCQICEREIKAPFGNAKIAGGGEFDTFVGTPTVAHHGYKRPHGEGWQTASCHGARHRPYELACDVIPPTIRDINDFIRRQLLAMKDLMENPPAEFVKFPRYGNESPRHYARPANFNPREALEKGSFSGKDELYAYYWKERYTNTGRSIADGRRDFERLVKRLAAWKEAHKETKEQAIA